VSTFLQEVNELVDEDDDDDGDGDDGDASTEAGTQVSVPVARIALADGCHDQSPELAAYRQVFIGVNPALLVSPLTLVDMPAWYQPSTP
jgi:hypothetical protein